MSVVGEVEPDFSQAWEYGYEHVTQEGSPLESLREAYGLSREQVEEMSGGYLPIPMQELLEDYPGLPDIEQLAHYARIFSTHHLSKATPRPRGRPWVGGERPTWTPGSLLDHLLEVVGEALRAEREADDAAEHAAHQREVT